MVLMFKLFYVIDGAKDARQIVMDLQPKKNLEITI
jgi:hypothetical protein